MALTVLQIGPVELARLAEIRAFAELPANHYRPGPLAQIPGDDARHVFRSGVFRAVFSITIADDNTAYAYRHASVSLVGQPPDRGPHPFAVFTIAHELGFEGATIKDGVAVVAGPTWAIQMARGMRDEVVIIVAAPWQTPGN